MNNIYSKKSIANNMMWRFGERILAQFVTFCVSVVLARQLPPAAFGDVALLMIFIDIANTLVSVGFASALVQKKDADNIDFSSVFYFSLIVACVGYCIAFFAAPLLVNIGDTALPVLFRVLSIRLFLAAVNSVQHAYVARKMLFKKYFFRTLIGTILSAFVGITLAYLGYGAWAIVFQYLTNSFCDAIILWFTIGWRPQLVIDFQRLRSLIGYGWKMLASHLVTVIYNRLSTFFIGTVYTTTDIAYYEQGNKIPGIIEANVDTTINSVLFPVLSAAQDDPSQLKKMMRRSIQLSSIIVWPMMIGLAILSDHLIRLIYTEKWLPAVPFMIIACFRLGFEPVQTANLQGIKAIGRSDTYLWLEIIKRGYGLIALLVAMRKGVMAIALAAASSTFFSAAVNGVANYLLFQYRIKEQIKDISDGFFLALLMGSVVFLLNRILPFGVFSIILEVFAGIGIYLALIYVFKRKDYDYLYEIVVNSIHKQKAK